MTAVRLLILVVALPAASVMAWMCTEPSKYVAHRSSRSFDHQYYQCYDRRRYRVLLRAQSAIDTEAAGMSPRAALQAAEGHNAPSSTSTTSQERTLHLVSLPSKDDSFSSPAESLVRDCWRWKDDALGDGRDYFVPRPRALRAFHSLFVGMEIEVQGDGEVSGGEVMLMLPLNEDIQSFPVEIRLQLNGTQQPSGHPGSKKFFVEECVAVSNCARLDVIVLKTIEDSDTNGIASSPYAKETAAMAARCAVAYNLHQQVCAYRSKDKSLLQSMGLASWLDLPDGVSLNTPPVSLGDAQRKIICDLSRRLTSLEGARPIINHLSMIAGGLAPRPNRPDREVIFRPYSSRDAHVLLQLKRTVEVISVSDGMDRQNDNNDAAKSGGRGRIKTLLDGALTAGKAARNEQVVPEIAQLKEYGSDGTPPSALANIVAEAAMELAVWPSVESCVAKLEAMEGDTAYRISQMRRGVDEMVASLEKRTNGDGISTKDHRNLRKVANRLLHEPTMRLREGDLSLDEIDNVLRSIEAELVDHVDRIR